MTRGRDDRNFGGVVPSVQYSCHCHCHCHCQWQWNLLRTAAELRKTRSCFLPQHGRTVQLRQMSHEQCSKMPTLFVAHGGGPLPIIGGAEHEPYRQHFRALQSFLPALPVAVVVISAHWEERTVSVMNMDENKMLYDYGGFPDAAYKLKYPAPGAPQLAAKIRGMLSDFKCKEVTDRGLDHGVFVPMILAWPEAQIPTLQVSLLSNLDPEAHIRLGRALAPLREEGVLLLGSGLAFHSMDAMFSFFRKGELEKPTMDKASAFDEWLVKTCTTPEWNKQPGGGKLSEREKRLVEWEQAPHARFCHPREEHLLPLLVCVGAAGEDNGEVIWKDPGVMGSTSSGYCFR